MGLSFAHIMIVLLVVVLLFGRGKISELMGDFAKGIKSFKQGLIEDEMEPKPSRKLTSENSGSDRVAS
ncbi:MAG: twin-arginine translocase TatA/TatE family subunit [Rhodomicrobiaceae bacterium]